MVYKHSRFAYAQEQATNHLESMIHDENNPLTKSLLAAHQKNLACIDHVVSVLTKRGIAHRVMCRSLLSQADTLDSFIISVGGDGTLLDVSHHCTDAPILGVNSDPSSSVGALCAAQQSNFEQVLEEIYKHSLLPTPLARLLVSIDNKKLALNPLNDLLFCHKNPMAMSRFSLSFKGKTELHRGSGLWVSTAAGSTGGIFSSGAKPLALEQENALFRVREPSYNNGTQPHLLEGMLGAKDILLIECQMSDAAIFIDGPHKTWDVSLGQTIEVGLAHEPLWLFAGKNLQKNRQKIIAERSALNQLLYHGGFSC